MLDDIENKTYSLAEILTAGCRVYFRNLGVLIPIVFIVYIPVNILLAFLPEAFLVRLGSTQSLRMEMFLVQSLEFFFGIVATIAILHVVQASVKGQPLGVGGALRQGVSRWGVVIFTQIIVCLIVGIAFLLLVVPGVILGIYYVFTVYVVALKGIGGMRALDYSKHIVRGQWLRIFKIMGVIYLLGILSGWGMRSLACLLPDNRLIEILFATGIDLVMTIFVVIVGVFFLNTDSQRSLSRAAQ